MFMSFVWLINSDYDSKPDCPIGFGKKLLCFRRGSNFEFLSVI